MASLVHNAPLGSSRDSGTGGMTGSEGMTGILCRVQPCPLRQFLHYTSNINAGEPSGLNPPMAVNGTKQRTLGDSRLFHPCLHGADRASFRIRAIRNTDLPSFAGLISFAPAKIDGEPVLPRGTIVCRQAHKFRPSKCSSEAQEDQATI